MEQNQISVATKEISLNNPQGILLRDTQKKKYSGISQTIFLDGRQEILLEIPRRILMKCPEGILRKFSHGIFKNFPEG